MNEIKLTDKEKIILDICSERQQLERILFIIEDTHLEMGLSIWEKTRSYQNRTLMMINPLMDDRHKEALLNSVIYSADLVIAISLSSDSLMEKQRQDIQLKMIAV